jgi:four helix bundle protein
MYQFYFEKLEVWQNSRQLVKDIYLATSSFPENEKFGITNQLRRASTSISANIAEGFSRHLIKKNQDS